MNTPRRSTPDTEIEIEIEIEIDHLGLYADGVRTLTRKFGVAAENQRDSAGILGRAAALRSMGALNRSKHIPILGICILPMRIPPRHPAHSDKEMVRTCRAI